MCKTYKGYELLKAIADEEIKDETKIEIKGRFSGDLIGSYFVYNQNSFCFPIYKPDGEKYCDDMSISDLINWKFRLIEDEIDIDNIDEMKQVTAESETYQSVYDNREKINELVQAVKQLDKKLKEKIID